MIFKKNILKNVYAQNVKALTHSYKRKDSKFLSVLLAGGTAVNLNVFPYIFKYILPYPYEVINEKRQIVKSRIFKAKIQNIF